MLLAKKIQRSKTEGDLERNIENLRAHCDEQNLEKFRTWFEKVYLCDDWLQTWIDLYRPSREGLFNTNNFTEALLKQLVPLPKVTSVANLILVIVETVFPYYENILEMEQSRLVSYHMGLIFYFKRLIFESEIELVPLLEDLSGQQILSKHLGKTLKYSIKIANSVQ